MLSCYPMTEDQLQILLACELDPRPGLYNLGSVYRFHGALDVDRLARAVSTVWAKHPALRTSLCDEHEDVLLRTMSPNAGTQSVFTVHERPNQNPYDAHSLEDDEFVRTLIAKSVHLYADRLFRIHLLTASPSEHLMVSVIHHLVFDAWSGGIFRRDLSNAYNQPACNVGQVTDEQEMPRHPADGTGTTRYREGSAYWGSYLADSPIGFSMTCYSDRERPELVIRPISSTLWRRVSELAIQMRVTPFIIFLAVFTALISDGSGSENVLFGVPISRRRDKISMEAIGLYINTLPFWCTVDPATPFADFIHQVQSRADGFYRHGDIPLSDVLKTIGRRRDRIGMAPYRISFNFLQAPTNQLLLDGVEVTRLRVAPNVIDAQMSMTIEAGDSGHVVQLLHVLGPDGSSIGEKLTDSYIDSLTRAVSAPHLPLRQVVYS
jgi:hypothetical protein